MSGELGNSTQEQELLRAVALWAADCAEQALPIFESRHPTDARPRQAIEGCREFGRGKRRDKNLRIVALAALKAGKGVDEPSKHAAQAATLAASVAYTHTDLQIGMQGVRQARHVLGPAVYAALALETEAGGYPTVGDDVVHLAIESAPAEVRYLLKHMPPQPRETGRLGVLFSDLDSALRG
jgi:Imm-5 like putative immunity protein